MNRWNAHSRLWSAAVFLGSLAILSLGATTSQAVPIDLTDATPSVSGATTLHIDGISTLGSSYWADFQWNARTNKFDVLAYGEESSVPEGFVLIEAGTFTMGSPEGEPGRSSDETEHRVTLTRGFYLSETEVTQAQWVAVMGSNPSGFPGCDDCPVESVNWYAAVDYCNALSELESLEPAYEGLGADIVWNQEANGYRLPTESEWEYACRAGSGTAFFNGDITYLDCDPLEPKLDEIGWYCGNAYGKPHPVGEKSANAWGLYDTSGNVWEWCWDWSGEYPDCGGNPCVDPVGSVAGISRAHRGGSWRNDADICRSANRNGYGPPGSSDVNLGFRPARWGP